MTIEPGLISVVIPTYRRPVALRAAVLSALRQTYTHTEIIVVADGPDAATRAAVVDLDARVRYFELPENAGPAAARNVGIAQSRGEWISFLDDDDLMLPERLERQAAVLDPTVPRVLSACRLVYRQTDGNGGTRNDVWPSRAIAPDEDLGDYLLYRPSLLGRPGVVSLQALIVHHTLARSVPMPTLPEHEDWAWLLDVWHEAGARILFFWEPLVVYNIDTSAESRSRRSNWQDSLHFAMTYRHLLSRRAFTSFLSTKVMLKARRAGDLRAMLQVLRLLVSNGAGLRDFLYFVAACLAPVDTSQRLWKHTLRNRMEPPQ